MHDNGQNKHAEAPYFHALGVVQQVAIPPVWPAVNMSARMLTTEAGHNQKAALRVGMPLPLLYSAPLCSSGEIPPLILRRPAGGGEHQVCTRRLTGMWLVSNRSTLATQLMAVVGSLAGRRVESHRMRKCRAVPRSATNTVPHNTAGLSLAVFFSIGRMPFCALRGGGRNLGGGTLPLGSEDVDAAGKTPSASAAPDEGTASSSATTCNTSGAGSPAAFVRSVSCNCISLRRSASSALLFFFSAACCLLALRSAASLAAAMLRCLSSSFSSSADFVAANLSSFGGGTNVSSISMTGTVATGVTALGFIAGLGARAGFVSGSGTGAGVGTGAGARFEAATSFSASLSSWAITSFAFAFACFSTSSERTGPFLAAALSSQSSSSLMSGIMGCRRRLFSSRRQYSLLKPGSVASFSWTDSL
mmetsp:Transcript_7507/g.21261  ORF Transcript_7507/g.21261 Transcript_7507/m.21261 type:complete len:418 (+) Transcript_7507:338-1591(+)